MVRLPPIIDFFFFLFSLLTAKVHNYSLCLLLFNFSPHSLNFLFRPSFFDKSFLFILSLNYNFSHALFFILVLILLIFNFFIVSVLLNPSLFLAGVSESILLVFIFYSGRFLFCWSFIYLQFSHSILICVYYVFQFGPSTFDFLFFPLTPSSKFLYFLILPFKSNLWFFFNINNIYFIFILFRLISYLFRLSFCQSFYDFFIISFKTSL